MKRLAVLGHPVSHSRSPAMQNAALEALGLADEWSYEAIDLAPEDFADRTRELAGEGFVGVNVTIPHKEAALAMADRASDAAREIGAANTLTFADGSIRADNTDAPGLLAALPDPVEGRTALVLGAGGSARAAVWALAGAGVPVSVWNRTPARADELVRDLADAGAGTESEGRLTPVSDEQALAKGYDLIVNCTAVGMARRGPLRGAPDRSGAIRCADRPRRPRLRRCRDTADRARRGPATRSRSTASRSWSARAPSRFGSGPAARRRSTSCGMPRGRAT